MSMIQNLPETVWSEFRPYDRWVAERTNGKLDGYFIDIGAMASPVSGTASLERILSWNGICTNHDIASYRSLRDIDNRRCPINTLIGLQTGTEEFRHADGQTVLTRTVSFPNLLSNNGCPFDIDLLVINLAGRELDIITSIPFKRYTINHIVVESRIDISWNMEQLGYELVINPYTNGETIQHFVLGDGTP